MAPSLLFKSEVHAEPRADRVLDDAREFRLKGGRMPRLMHCACGAPPVSGDYRQTLLFLITVDAPDPCTFAPPRGLRSARHG